ncbi:MAG: Tm-1-like ATP-binding domain-containing protein [Deltaproteobacteria bacterium]|nr:MAG: Tm-1-like ATP-binding domain-containing protein [Deltaproteobacteria bacterium]
MSITSTEPASKSESGVLLVATMDTKGKEALYLESCIKGQGISVFILDAGIRSKSPYPVSICREEVARAGGKSLHEVQRIGNEGNALEVMTTGAIRCAKSLCSEGKIGGIIGLGGSMGTTLGTGVMRAFPIGFPKVMISTMASRDTRPFVGTKDIVMVHSVCDLSGINRITQKVLRNGALAIAGMVRKDDTVYASSEKPLVALSTLSTTDACAAKVRESLEELGNEVVTFHTVGSGGEAKEELIEQGEADAVVDLSLHEIADHFFGGDYDAGPGRGKAALQRGIPAVLVPGNLDFLATGPLHEAKRRFPGRRYHVHNSAITLVRTEKDEIVQLARILAGLCNAAKGPLSILLPLGGFSVLDAQEGPFYDPEAPQLFADTMKKALRTDVQLLTLPYHVNDPDFAMEIVQSLTKLSELIA